MKWNILVPEREKEIKKIIEEVIQCLFASSDEELKSFNLVAGKIGLVTLLSYFEKTTGEKKYHEYIEKYMDEITNALENETMNASLHYGFAGIGWLFQHLSNISYLEEFDPTNLDEIDMHVYTGIEKNFEVKNYDLLAGMVGQGIYLLERYQQQPNVKKYVENLVDLFEKMAEKDKDGIYWREYRYWDVENYKDGKPEEVLNLGVAHGMPAIVGLLAHIYKAGIAPEKTGYLLTESRNWLWKQRIKNQDYSFNYSVGQEGISRLAWCYGDPGVAIVLLQAGLYTQNQTWIDEAIEVALLSTKRKTEGSGIVDTGFCHGAIGLSHIYNRFYQVTKNEAFKTAAIYWLDETLRMRKPEIGMGGFYFYNRDKKDATFINYVPAAGWLEGGIGIALSLLALVTDVNPTWDHVFMMKVD